MKSNLPCHDCITLGICKASMIEHAEDIHVVGICWCVLYTKCSLFKKYYEYNQLWLSKNNSKEVLTLFGLSHKIKARSNHG